MMHPTAVSLRTRACPPPQIEPRQTDILLVHVKDVLSTESLFRKRFLNFLKFVQCSYTDELKNKLLCYAADQLQLDGMDFEQLLILSRGGGFLPRFYTLPLRRFLSNVGYTFSERWRPFLGVKAQDFQKFLRQAVHNRKATLFGILPEDIVGTIRSFLSFKQQTVLARTCTTLRTIARRTEDMTTSILFKGKVKAFVQACCWSGNQRLGVQHLRILSSTSVSLDAIEAICHTYPNLMTLSLGLCSTDLASLWASLKNLHRLQSLSFSLAYICQVVPVNWAGPPIDFKVNRFEGPPEGLEDLTEFRLLGLGATPSLEDLHAIVQHLPALRVFEVHTLIATELTLNRISQNRGLKEIYFRNYEGSVQALVEMFGSMPQLESFGIENLTATGEVLQALGSCTNLTKIKIASVAQGQEEALMVLLAGLPKLRRFEAPQLCLTAGSLQELVALPLEHITAKLANNVTRSVLAQYVKSSKLKSFWFNFQQAWFTIDYQNDHLSAKAHRGCSLAVCDKIVASLLKSLPRPLHQFSGDSSGDSDTPFASIARILVALVTSQPQLKSLEIREIRATPLGPETLIAISGLTKLRSLTLECCDLTDDVLASFQSLKKLRKLDLVRCKVSNPRALETLKRQIPNFKLS